MMTFRPVTGIAADMFGLDCWASVKQGTEYLIWRIPADDLGPETFRVNKAPTHPRQPLDGAYSNVGDAFTFPQAVELAEQDAKEMA